MKCITIILALFCFSVQFTSAQNEDINQRIYDEDTIVWFGLDMSLMRLTNYSKIGTEHEVLPYLSDWVVSYASAFPNVKMASMLKRRKVYLDTLYTASAFKTNLPAKWIISDPHALSEYDIEDYVKEITTKHHGVGLIFIIENLFKGESGLGNEVPSEVRGKFVWFDIDTRQVLHIQSSIGTPNTVYFTGGSSGNPGGLTVGKRKRRPAQRGFEGYWLQGMIDATSSFTLKYKDKMPREEQRY